MARATRRGGQMRRSILSVLAMVSVVAGLGASAAPASAGPTSGTSTVAVPVTCTFGPNTPIFTTTAHVSVTAPSITPPLLAYNASFRVHLDGITAPFDVQSFAMSSTYNISGPVNPHGA